MLALYIVSLGRSPTRTNRLEPPDRFNFGSFLATQPVTRTPKSAYVASLVLRNHPEYGQVTRKIRTHCDMTLTHADPYPRIRTVGLDGLLISFAGTMAEPSNRAALAFRNAIDSLRWDGVIETSASLASAYVRFDPLSLTHSEITSRVEQVLLQQDWYQASLPPGRRLWQVPTVYGGELAPQLNEAAAVAGLSIPETIRRLSETRVRVLTIGFAPGQPYLGPLGPEFNIPRLRELTPMVPEGALVLAISQFVLFSGPTPTGWRHVGQTAFRCFRPEAQQSFALRPGDEMQFLPVTRDELEDIRANDDSGSGGATCEEITG